MISSSFSRSSSSYFSRFSSCVVFVFFSILLLGFLPMLLMCLIILLSNIASIPTLGVCFIVSFFSVILACPSSGPIFCSYFCIICLLLILLLRLIITLLSTPDHKPSLVLLYCPSVACFPWQKALLAFILLMLMLLFWLLLVHRCSVLDMRSSVACIVLAPLVSFVFLCVVWCDALVCLVFEIMFLQLLLGLVHLVLMVFYLLLYIVPLTFVGFCSFLFVSLLSQVVFLLFSHLSVSLHPLSYFLCSPSSGPRSHLFLLLRFGSSTPSSHHHLLHFLLLILVPATPHLNFPCISFLQMSSVPLTFLSPLKIGIVQQLWFSWLLSMLLFCCFQCWICCCPMFLPHTCCMD